MDVPRGTVTVHYREKGEEKVASEHLDLPPDLANGVLLDLLKNIEPNAAETRISYLVATPKPRLVHIVIKPDGEDRFTSAGRGDKAIRYRLHIDLGGLEGVIAPMVGKEPPDAKVWVSSGDVPAFLRAEVPLFVGGPVVRTQLVSPVWSKSSGMTE